MKHYFKWGSILGCFIMVLFLFRGCGRGKTKDHYIITETVKIDTVEKPIYMDSEYILHETVVYKDREVVLHDTLEIFNEQKFDTAKVLARFFATKFYRDTVKLKGLKGYVLVEDNISQNAITKRTIKERYSIPEITKTITLTKPPRTTLYLGTDINGNKEYPLYSIGVNAGLLMRNQKYWGVQYSLTKDGAGLWGIRFMLPIKTRK